MAITSTTTGIGYAGLSEYDRMQDRLLMGQTSAGIYPQTTVLPTVSMLPSLTDMIYSRLRHNPHLAPPIAKHLQAHQLNAETVVTFVIAGENHITLEDEAALFPSDAFITQLRLFMEANK